MGVKIADKLEQFNNGTYYLVDSSAVEYKQADGSSISVQQALENGVELTKEGVEGLLGLTKEEIEAMTDLILDTEVRIDKTYSSSKIYTDIQQCLEDSKTYTLEELGKKIGASYEVVTSIDDMVSQDRLYLLNNGNNYDIYIVDVDNVPVVIGDTSIDLSGYVTKTEIESELGTERLGTTSQTVKGAINELFQSVTNEGDITDIENRLTKLEAIRHYNSIEELGLDSTANINDIITAMNNNTTFTYSSNMFDITEYNNVNYGTVLINKLSSSRVQVLMTDKYTADLYVGKINNNNQFDGWIKNNTVNTTDLTEINDKITQLENKQIKNIKTVDMDGNAPIYKIKPSGTNHISKISMVDLYGGCILITGSAVSSEYKPFKVVRLSNGNWESYYPSLTGANKLDKVYYDGSFIYVKCNNYIKCYIEGGFETVEKVTTLPTGVTELPILDLTQGSTVDLTPINTKLAQLETKAALIPVVADNPTDYDLNNYKENGNYSIGDASKYNNLPEPSYGLLTVTRSNTFRLQVYTVMSNNNVYFRKSTSWGNSWGSWVLLNGSSGGSGNDIYTDTQQEIGTWVNGKTLYRKTIKSNGTKSPITNISVNVTTVDLSKYTVVKVEGVQRIRSSSSSSANPLTYPIPYFVSNGSELSSILVAVDDSNNVFITTKNLSDYYDYGYDITIYYTDK